MVMSILGCLAATTMATGAACAFNSWLSEQSKCKTLAIGGAVAYVIVLVLFLLNR
jgi:hypothetical protein